MKKYLFSIICFIIAASIPIYLLLAPLWVDNETFVYTAGVIGSFTTSILLMVVGMANMPRKEESE